MHPEQKKRDVEAYLYIPVIMRPKTERHHYSNDALYVQGGINE